MLPTDHDDFFDEMPTIVMIKRLIEDAIAEAECEVDGEFDDDDLDPLQFRAIGTR